MLILFSMLAVILSATPSFAQSDAEADKKPTLRIRGHVELDFSSEHNFNLDRSSDEDFTTLEPEIRFRLGYHPHPFYQFFVSIRPRRKFDLHDEDKKKDRVWVIQLEQLYFATESRNAKHGFYFGRERFRDNREWLYDEYLDGGHGFFQISRLRLDASMNRLLFFSDDLIHEALEDPIVTMHVYANIDATDDVFVAAYWLGQDNRSTSGEQVQHVGLRSGGEPRKGLVYWAELGHVFGDFDGLTISGTGFDVGLHYELPVKAKPYPIIGYAFGTGDNNPDDDTNNNFRQTGYQDNNGRFGGVAKYKFYGELLEPNLSNMGIVTAGAGFRPWKKTSFDLLYHHYKQHHASEDMARNNLDADPDGMHSYLGQELDFVIGFREIKNLRAEAIAAWFFPGSAFDPAADYSFYSGIEFRYYY